MSSLDIDLNTATPLQRVRYLMARLREPEYGCPWDLKQTYQSIAPFTVEEAYEVADTILREDYEHLREELGDLMFQVVFYSQMAEEEGRFQFDDVLMDLEQKLVRRHPHVFPEGTLDSRIQPGEQVAEHTIKSNWDAIKQQEKADKNQLGESILDGMPAGMSPTRRAHKLQSVVAKKGFDWQDSALVMAKLEEELGELGQEVYGNAPNELIADELGDLMFCCVNLARHYKLDPELVMMKANQKFERRFRALERALQRQGVSLEEATLEQMEQEWQQAKKTEVATGDEPQ
ncbi:MAG: nucleoside triphosphate pyrophosphohydrolase [Pseudomonadales bacterium]|nr:nucleoside triphosphate pyrophosphohydrolase [Pseudomonadales bacterium]MEC8813672.1 nucleoside triphosphate pyrophosphohydrolase [Pseudomonadota bacterium]HAG95411.1 nucleoside triphosphate pyrophosphohydrolase [Gammaproteobacteria bacterium]MBI26972.1 nucleoside triphosphate pyrophosphohydrolase [Pseudomonadales bacterium]HAU14032.1 nucleoside triphosphate pyrophosphohydrolase [Gammaproteobacteria bacterium]|tara:strand:- start:100 stop:966 length:867 start_codon:yes stop_codon:yes gene_type:complete